MLRWGFALSFVFTLAACTPRPPESFNDLHQQSLSSTRYFSDRLTNFQVDVFYENSAAPYTGPVVSGHITRDTWDFTAGSFAELFKTHTARTITVPHEPGQMTPIPDQHVAVWSPDSLIALGLSLQKAPAPGQQIATVIFVHGSYSAGAGSLGVQIIGYTFCFIFKDNLEKMYGSDIDKRYREQSAVVHELGHVVGLVNSGVPMQQNHEDAEHPHHSTDPDDVMYWTLTSPADLTRLNLFGVHSLADGQGYHTP